MDGRTHTTVCAHLRFVQYYLILTHALQAPIRVNATSERIPTHPVIKVKSGNQSKAVPSNEKSGN